MKRKRWSEKKNREGKSRVPLSVTDALDACLRDVTFVPTEKKGGRKQVLFNELPSFAVSFPHQEFLYQS